MMLLCPLQQNHSRSKHSGRKVTDKLRGLSDTCEKVLGLLQFTQIWYTRKFFGGGV